MNKNSSSYKSADFFELKKLLEFQKLKSKEKQTIKLEKKSILPSDHNKHFKKQEKSQNDMNLLRKLQKRYKELEDKYKELLEKVKERGLEHQKTKTQLEQYKKQHERDKNEIERLRYLLGLVKKRSISIQVDIDPLASSNGFRASRINKFDQSTEDQIKLKNSGQKFNSRQKTSPQRMTKRNKFEQISMKLFPETTFMEAKSTKEPISPIYKYSKYQKIEKEDSSNMRASKKLSNSPYSKYRFVPTTHMN